MTFKENINDFRNSKSISLANELKAKGHKVSVLDDAIDASEFKKNNQLNIIKKPKKKYYDGIIITVSHKKYKSLNEKYFNSLLKNQNGTIFDIKNIYNNKRYLSL